MSDTKVKSGIVQKVMDFMRISESMDAFQLYESLTKFRNQMHPDLCYDEESKKIAATKFVEANQLLTDLNTFINKEKFSKSYKDLCTLEKDYALVNARQKIIDKEKEIDFLNQKIQKCRTVIKQLLERQKILSKEVEQANFDDIRTLYKNTGKIKTEIGLKIAAGFVYSFITGIDQISNAINQYLPFDKSILTQIIFGLILLSILWNLRSLVKAKIIEMNSKKIETTTLISKFSQLISKSHTGSKMSEIQIFEFIKSEVAQKNRLFRFVEKIVGSNDDIVIEKYKNVFITNLLEKQLIKISRAKSLDREFYVFGTSLTEQMNERNEMNTELINESDIDSLIEE